MITFTWHGNDFTWLLRKGKYVVKVTQPVQEKCNCFWGQISDFFFLFRRVNTVIAPIKQSCNSAQQSKTSTQTRWSSFVESVLRWMEWMRSRSLYSSIMMMWAVSQRSPYGVASFCAHIPHFTTSTSPRSILYSLAHSNKAPLLHAKLTPQVLLHLLTDTCPLKMIPSPAASIAARSGGLLDSIIKLKKRDRARGWGEKKAWLGREE